MRAVADALCCDIYAVDGDTVRGLRARADGIEIRDFPGTTYPLSDFTGREPRTASTNPATSPTSLLRPTLSRQHATGGSSAGGCRWAGWLMGRRADGDRLRRHLSTDHRRHFARYALLQLPAPPRIAAQAVSNANISTDDASTAARSRLQLVNEATFELSVDALLCARPPSRPREALLGTDRPLLRHLHPRRQPASLRRGASATGPRPRVGGRERRRSVCWASDKLAIMSSPVQWPLDRAAGRPEEEPRGGRAVRGPAWESQLNVR